MGSGRQYRCRGEYAFDALADPHRIVLQGLFALPCRVGGANRNEPAIQFPLNHCGILEHPNDLGPDNLIQQILPDRSARAADRLDAARVTASNRIRHDLRHNRLQSDGNGTRY
jgi:hypothetical protein